MYGFSRQDATNAAGPPKDGEIMNPLTRSTTLSVATAAALAALCAWQHYRRPRDARYGERSARRLRRIADQLDRIEQRVNELSSDRIQAAAAVTRLFAVSDTGGKSWEKQDARRSR